MRTGLAYLASGFFGFMLPGLMHLSWKTKDDISAILALAEKVDKVRHACFVVLFARTRERTIGFVSQTTHRSRTRAWGFLVRDAAANDD